MKCLGTLAAAAILAAVAVSADAQQTRVTPTQDVGVSYQETWDWCGERFPYREDLQEACRWGAYEMIPGQEVRVDEEGVQDA